MQLRGEPLSELLSPEETRRVGTLLSVPLRRGGQVLGMLNAYSNKVQRAFLPREEKALVVLGDRAATSVENALLYADMENTFRETIQGLALALEAKDAYTHGHSENVTRLCEATAGVMGLDEASGILNKPGRLDPEEYAVIQSHPRLGRRILEPISFLKDAVPIVYHHHERWDGKGYPAGLSGEEIPLSCRIMAVADTYDAMTSDRPYREGLTHEVAVAELRRCSGTQFEPQCVQAFLEAHDGDLTEPK